MIVVLGKKSFSGAFPGPKGLSGPKRVIFVINNDKKLTKRRPPPIMVALGVIMIEAATRNQNEGEIPPRKKGLTLIFDFDGTIADTLAAIVRLANRYNKALGIPPLDQTDIEAMRGMLSRP